MSKFYDIKESTMIYANYHDPEPHKHLASHIIISLGGNMIWDIEGEKIVSRGICIDFKAVHSGAKSKLKYKLLVDNRF